MDSEDEDANPAAALGGLGALGGMAAMAGGGGGGLGGLGAMAGMAAGAPPGALGALGALGGSGALGGGLGGALGGGALPAIGQANAEPQGAVVKADPAPDATPPPADGDGAEEENTDAMPQCADFFVKERATTCRGIFIPEGSRFNTGKLQQLFYEVWKCKEVSTLVSCDAGTVHPVQFATPALAALPAFRKSTANAMKHVERAYKDATDEEKKDKALDVINDVLFLKLKTVFASVLDAAEIAGNWLVVDRVNAKSPASELLIECALSQTSARPMIVCVDAFTRLKNFTCPEAKACKDKLCKIRKVGAAFGTDAPIGEEVINQFYSHEEFMDPSAFYDEAVKPLPRPPEPAHVGEDGTISNRVKWQYHYLQTFYGSGTHYIVLDSHHDAPDLSGLGPYGYVCANGQGIMYDRVKSRIQNGEAMVMLHNTGGVCQAFCSLRKGMLSKLPVPESSELLEKLEIVSPQSWAKNFGLPEVLMMKELHQRAPMLLRTTCMAVDLLEDGSESVLSVLTCCFSGGGGVPELGLGEAEKLCVLTAWKRHMTLLHNARKFEKNADYLQLLLYALAVITTTVSVLDTMEKNGQFFNEDEAAAEDGGRRMLGAVAGVARAGLRMLSENGTAGDGAAEDPDANPMLDKSTIGYAILMLPIASTLISMIRAGGRPREKWATSLMASNQIVDQIYKYRLRTDRYDTQAAPPPLPDGTIPEISPKMRETNARKSFVETCNEIYSNAMQEVSKGGALKMGKGHKLQTTNDAERTQFESMLNTHLKKTLHAGPDGGLQPSMKPKKGKGGKAGAGGLPADPAQAAALAKQAGMLSKLPIVGKLLGGKGNKVGAADGLGSMGGMDPAMLAGAAGALGGAGGAAGGAGALGALGGPAGAAGALGALGGPAGAAGALGAVGGPAGAAGALGAVGGPAGAAQLAGGLGALQGGAGGAGGLGALGALQGGGAGGAGGLGALGGLGGFVDGAMGVVGEAVGADGQAAGDDAEASGDVFLDDMVSQMDIETYVACRVRPVTAYLEGRAVVMSRRQNLLEFLIIGLNTGSSVLAVLDYTEYIVITTALVSAFMAILDYFYIPSQLSTTNKAVESCHNLITWWDSLSLVQRKTRSAKKQACLTVEGALLEICAARTAASSALPSEQAEEEPEE